MSYNIQYIESLLPRYMEDSTTEEEEQILKDYFTTNEDIPEELEPYRELFCSYDTDVYDFSEEEVDAMFATKETPRQKSLWTWVAVAACFAGFLFLYLTPPKTTTESVVASHVSDSHIYMHNQYVRDLDSPDMYDSFESAQRRMRERGQRLRGDINKDINDNILSEK